MCIFCMPSMCCDLSVYLWFHSAEPVLSTPIVCGASIVSIINSIDLYPCIVFANNLAFDDN